MGSIKHAPGCPCCDDGGGGTPLDCSSCTRLRLTASGFTEHVDNFPAGGSFCGPGPWTFDYIKSGSTWAGEDFFNTDELATVGCANGLRINPSGISCETDATHIRFLLEGGTSASDLWLSPVTLSAPLGSSVVTGTRVHNGQTITFTLECVDGMLMAMAAAAQEAAPHTPRAGLVFNDLARGPCIHRGETLREERCQFCGQKDKLVPIFACESPDAPAPEVSEARWRHAQPRRETCGGCGSYEPEEPTA